MGRKPKYTKETKIKAIKEYIEGRKSFIDICNDLNCGKTPLRMWIKLFNQYGDSIFDDKPFNSTYTREFKENVVKEYLDGKGSIESLQIKCKILSHSTLRKWILKYNKGIILKDYKPMSEVYTMKSRKVSYEERIEIVNYCISNNYDYKGTANKYFIPYAQVYTWVKKVKENGYESLKLQKKCLKSKYLVESKTSEELLELENERLKRENERLQLELEVLKKSIVYKNEPTLKGKTRRILFSSGLFF